MSTMPTTTVRPDCALSHGDEEALVKKANAAMKSTNNPLEKLRYFCLTKGATGVLGLRRSAALLCGLATTVPVSTLNRLQVQNN